MEESITHRETALRSNPLETGWTLDLAYYYCVAERYEDALAQIRETMALTPNHPLAHWALGAVYMRRGLHEDVSIAFIYIGLGETDQAFLWLDRAYSERAAMAVGLPTHLWVDPLRGDPRFQDLLRRMNFPE